MSDLKSANTKVYIVAFIGESVGGFDWFYKEEDAKKEYAERLSICEEFQAVIFEIASWSAEVPHTDRDEITDHISEQEWYTQDIPEFTTLPNYYKFEAKKVVAHETIEPDDYDSTRGMYE